MKFQLMGDWPCRGGAMLVPTGTVLDFDNWKWCGMPLPWPVPPNVIALDQAAYDELLSRYPYNQILSAPGVDRTGDPPKIP